MCSCVSGAISSTKTVIANVVQATCNTLSYVANLIQAIAKAVFNSLTIAFQWAFRGASGFCRFVTQVITELGQPSYRYFSFPRGADRYRSPFVVPGSRGGGYGGHLYSAKLSVHADGIARDPIPVLKRLLESIKANREFPEIAYVGSIGADEGGLTRDFVTRLFESLYAKDGCKLPTRVEDERHIPRLDYLQAAPDLQTQIDCYKAIGTIFAFVLKNHRGIQTGNHFDPVFFRLVHFLASSERLNRIEDINRIPQEIFDELLKIYIQAKYPFFKKDDIANLLKGNITDELRSQAVENIDTFVDDIHFEEIARAVILIANAMCEQMYGVGVYGSVRAGTAQESKIRGKSAIQLAEAIEGSLSRERVLAALAPQQPWFRCPTDGFLRRWVREAEKDQLSKFVFAITGSSTLKRDQKLLIDWGPDPKRLPVYHTCSFQMDIPGNYPDYQTFKRKLEQSLSSVEDFQLC